MGTTSHLCSSMSSYWVMAMVTHDGHNGDSEQSTELEVEEELDEEDEMGGMVIVGCCDGVDKGSWWSRSNSSSSLWSVTADGC